MARFLHKILSKIPGLRRFSRSWEIDRANLECFSSLMTHEILVADKIRTEAYAKAIKRHVQAGQVVLDLGAGAGMLSFLASLQNPKSIYAVDRSRVLRLARQIADANKIKNISFVEKSSFDFSIEEKADVILHDQIGDFLVNENMLAKVLDWRDRLLKPGGRILPGRFELYLEPVQIKDEFHIPFLHENNVHGIDFSCLKKNAVSAQNTLRLEFDQIGRYFSAPEKVLEIDLQTIRREDIPKNIVNVKKVLSDGRMDGFFLYFKIIFDEETSLSTDFSNSWLNWTRQLLRCESMDLKAGQLLKADFHLPDLRDPSSWEWKCSVSDEEKSCIADPSAIGMGIK